LRGILVSAEGNKAPFDPFVGGGRPGTEHAGQHGKVPENPAAGCASVTSPVVCRTDARRVSQQAVRLESLPTGPRRRISAQTCILLYSCDGRSTRTPQARDDVIGPEDVPPKVVAKGLATCSVMTVSWESNRVRTIAANSIPRSVNFAANCSD
jgi:hypothetical protein